MKRSRRRSTWRIIPAVGASVIQRSGRTRNGRDSRKLTSSWDAPASWDWLEPCMHQMFGSSTSHRDDRQVLPQSRWESSPCIHVSTTDDLLTSFYLFDHRDRVTSPPSLLHPCLTGRWKTKHERFYLIIYLLRYSPPYLPSVRHLFTFRGSSRSSM